MGIHVYNTNFHELSINFAQGECSKACFNCRAAANMQFYQNLVHNKSVQSVFKNNSAKSVQSVFKNTSVFEK